MRASAKKHYTFEDYLALPEDNARRHEIIGGELFATLTPRPRHQDVVTNLTILLGTLSSVHPNSWPRCCRPPTVAPTAT